ncbi:aspartic proteinase 36-like, partial [Solanum stenotomum]|uniref:aspartic proteinase 36-like n=1 Tax=Solanum stenotomum TaxID=172797 RepID=UPI0020D082EA
IYYTKVKVGSPPKEYNLLVDTGSEISWIACSSCDTCPRTSELGVKLNFYDSGNSTTATSISCSTRGCECTRTNRCGFTLSYMDGSSTTGYLVSDVWHLDTFLSTSSTYSSSAPIIFGCSTSQFGNMVLTDNAIDGIIGFDRHRLSLISQLSSHGISRKVFSHCLKGESGINAGGGVLVLGEILNPSMVYTPLVPSMGHYNVDLQSIAVNGKLLHIDPAAFETSEDEDRGTIFDSGTSLIYLVAEAYDSVISAITTATSSSAKSITSGITPCYLISSSSSNNVTKIFPQITLHFAGGVSMDLRPADYLSLMGSIKDTAQWCVLFMMKSQSLTILGDIALRDKSIVYDLAHQRIGWADHDCSLPVNVSIPSGTNQVISARAILFHMLESLLCMCLFWW